MVGVAKLKARSRKKPERRAPSKLGRRIRLSREKLGVDQCALAKAVDMHPQSLNRLELGWMQSTSLKRVRAIADELGVPFEWLAEELLS